MGEASLQCLATVCKKVERWPAVFECTLLPPSSSLKSLVSGKAFACLVMGFIAPKTKKHTTITKPWTLKPFTRGPVIQAHIRGKTRESLYFWHIFERQQYHWLKIVQEKLSYLFSPTMWKFVQGVFFHWASPKMLEYPNWASQKKLKYPNWASP